MNKLEGLNDEIDSYELNEHYYNQNLKNSTLLMDRFANESPEDMNEIRLRNLKPSSGWLIDTQQTDIFSKPNEVHIIENDENFITELDVNSTDLITSQNRKLSQNPNNLKELNLFIENHEDVFDSLPYHISNNVLSLEQLDDITKKDNESLFMLDDLNLSLLSKYLIKETNSNQLEIDSVWTLDGLITEMTDCFKNL